MTKEEANIEARKIIRERNRKADEIIAKAIAEGIYHPGLDGNEELFIDLNIATKKQLADLKTMIDE